MAKTRFLIYVFLLPFASCLKVPIEIIDNVDTADPNISFFDNYEVELATYKIDSFITSGNSTLSVGYHKDPIFGELFARSYAQIDLPSTNPLKDKNVSFDSLELIVLANGEYYGDTLTPVRIFAYPRSFLFDPDPIGSTLSIIQPQKGKVISIKLSEQLGEDLLLKLKNNSNEIQDNASFVNFFSGISLGSSPLSASTIYYFKPDSSGSIMRLHYHLNGAFSESKTLDFPMSVSKQFSNFGYSHSGTNLSVFTPYKNQIKKSSLTGNKAYLHTNMSSFIKISFPTILQLKELYPYVKVVKAELEIKPSKGTYNYPYELPSALYLYTTDDRNLLKEQLIDNFSQTPLTGNLNIDRLFGENTKYHFDITGFVNQLIEEGHFSKSALMIVPSGSFATQLQRLVIDDQTQGRGVQLKLYLLGL
jgi:Domain of unknown function (DUF4270)